MVLVIILRKFTWEVFFARLVTFIFLAFYFLHMSSGVGGFQTLFDPAMILRCPHFWAWFGPTVTSVRHGGRCGSAHWLKGKSGERDWVRGQQVGCGIEGLGMNFNPLDLLVHP